MKHVTYLDIVSRATTKTVCWQGRREGECLSPQAQNRFSFCSPKNTGPLPLAREREKRRRRRRRKLTVHHLDDAALAGQALGELVATGDHVSVVRTFRHSLVSLCCSAGRVDVIPPRMVRVDRTEVGSALQEVRGRMEGKSRAFVE